MASFKIIVFVLTIVVSIRGQVIEPVRIDQELSKCTNGDRASCILYYELIRKKCKTEHNEQYCLTEVRYKNECNDYKARANCIIYKCGESDGASGHCLVQFMWQYQTESIAFFVCLGIITVGLIIWCCKRGCWGCCKNKSGVKSIFVESGA